jgi:hypothetical protein
LIAGVELEKEGSFLMYMIAMTTGTGFGTRIMKQKKKETGRALRELKLVERYAKRSRVCRWRKICKMRWLDNASKLEKKHEEVN